MSSLILLLALFSFKNGVGQLIRPSYSKHCIIQKIFFGVQCCTYTIFVHVYFNNCNYIVISKFF